MKRMTSFLTRMIFYIIFVPLVIIISHSAEEGALLMLYVATSPIAESGYILWRVGSIDAFPREWSQAKLPMMKKLLKVYNVSSELNGVRLSI